MPNPPVSNRRGPRAGGYHVRTGCVTCKIRRIKCDEEKPACLKCRGTGRKCDGYLDKATTTPIVSRHSILRCHSSPPLSAAPSTAIVGTSRERAGFEFFRLQIGEELSKALGLDLAKQLILQASHFNAAIKSAAISVGLMGQRLRVNKLMTSASEEANVYQDLAQSQYCKALRSLREQLSRDSSQSEILVSCLLFTIFEFLMGNASSAVIHLRSGLHVLRQDQDKSHSASSLMDELQQIFAAVDVQATMWLGLKTFQTYNLGNFDDPSYSPSTLHHFVNMNEVSNSLDFQITRIYRFRRWVTTTTDTLGSRYHCSPSIVMRLEDLVTDLEGWQPAVSSLLKRLSRQLDSEESCGLAVMRMNYLINLLMLKACLQDDEFAYYRSSEPIFRQIIDLAKRILEPVTYAKTKLVEDIVRRYGDKPMSLFTFCAGVIQPLYLTAIKCRSSDICKAAIELLSASPWREGAWDSASMARIASRAVQKHMEEGYYSNIPTYKRRSTRGVEDDLMGGDDTTYSTGAQIGVENWMPTWSEDIKKVFASMDRTALPCAYAEYPDLQKGAEQVGSRAGTWDIAQVFQM